MCTLTVALRRHPSLPLLLAANRDERQDRAASGPRVWPGDPAFVAGRDEEAGGTWLGANANGVVVGLTNHWCGRPADPSLESRGDVVAELLRGRDLAEVRARVADRDPARTNPFLLLVADVHGEGFWCSSEEGLRAHELEAGVFSLGNRPPHPEDERPHAARAAVEAALVEHGDGPVESLRRSLQRALATHVGDRGPLVSPCVHTGRNFGTVSATVLLAGPGTRAYWHAPGPPCTTGFEDHSARWASLAKGN